jgi:hypothetical protein
MVKESLRSVRNSDIGGGPFHMQDLDPLWYDRAEPEEKPGTLLRIAAVLFVGALGLYGLPDRLYQVLGERVVRRVFRPDPRS